MISPGLAETFQEPIGEVIGNAEGNSYGSQSTESINVRSAVRSAADYEYSISNNEATITKYIGLGGVVTIPDNIDGYPVTNIGNSTFAFCSGLTSVVIPESVTIIRDRAFENCTNLTSVIIPNSVTSIGNYAFSGCSGLTSVTIPNSVTSIGYSAFENCTNLTSVIIPNSVTSIEGWVFFGCSALTSVMIPTSVTNIGDSAFSDCSALTSVIIPNSVTSIGDYAFSGCSALNCVTIPNSVTSIGYYAFSGCSGLRSVTIPNSVTSIGEWAFSDCSGLTSVTIPNSVTSIEGWVFFGCSTLTSVMIPTSVTNIGDSAFAFCSALTSVTIPTSVTNIGDSAFAFCSGLRSVAIPNSITSIGNSAFYRCFGLTSVVIGANVTSIGNNAFLRCSNLTSVYFAGVPPELPDDSVFSFVPAIAYYISCTPGWGAEFGGLPTAVWTSIATFNGNGGTPTLREQTYNVGAAYAELPNASRSGYSFAGWWTAPHGGSLIDISTLTPFLTSGHTLYAQWNLFHEISISSLDDLQKIGNDPAFPLDGHYYLTGDIDASPTANWNNRTGFLPIGNYEHPFTGTIDGCGFTVTELHVNQIWQNDNGLYGAAGLFGVVGESAKICNLHIRDGSVAGFEDVGGLIGVNDGGAVTDCSFTGRIAPSEEYYSTTIGGLIGRNEGLISWCYANARTKGCTRSAGGLVGINYSQISDSFATGPVNGFEASGGFCGSNFGIISTSCATGTINNLGTGTDSRSGEEWGQGGFCGWNAGEISFCYANGRVYGVDGPVGGFCGGNAGSISFSHANGSVDSIAGSVGGLVGSNEGELFACYSTSAVRSGIEESYNYGGGMTGGLCGENSGSIDSCYATGNVMLMLSNDDEYYYGPVGGLIGSNDSNVSNCFASGSVTCGLSSTKGGLIGYNNGQVAYCFANGKINFLQENPEDPYREWIYNRTGGLIGGGSSTLVTHSCWDRNVNGRVLSAGGESKTSAEMTDSSAIMTTYEDWDFETTWQADADGQLNRGYPYLAAIPPQWTITFNIDGTGGNPILVSEVNGTEIVPPELPSRRGYRFLGWDQDIPTVMPANNLTITALWEIAPVEISSIEELQKISYDPDYPADIHYYLSQNIDASATVTWNNGEGFLPISNNENPFTGTFDGRGHIITGLVIFQPEWGGNALFARVWEGGIVKNVGLVGGSISGFTAAGLADKNSGLIHACFTSISVTGEMFTGGLVGHNIGTISSSYTLGSTSGVNRVGGLVASNLGTVSFCYAAGQVTGVEFTGGLIGVNEGTVFASCWDQQSTGQETSAGGVGCSSEQMQWPFDRVISYPGWDFSFEWMEDTELLHNNGYPYLQTCPPPSLATRALIFDSDGGTPMEPVFRVSGSRIPPQPDPELPGSTFIGWEPIVPEFMSDSDLTVTAQWSQNNYTVTFSPGDHGEFPEQLPEITFTVTHGTDLPGLPEIHPGAGYVFTGWEPELPLTVTGKLELVAQYQLDIVDTDNDNLPDWWEWQHFCHLDFSLSDDPDGDLFTNWEEFVVNSDPNDPLSYPADRALVVWHEAIYKLRRIGLALQEYTAIHSPDVFPGRLQHLVDEGYLNAFMLQAIGDESQGTDPPPHLNLSGDAFSGAHEPGVSFFYELSEAPCLWSLPGFWPASNPYSWYDLKMFQLMEGGSWGGDHSIPYDRRAFPVVRFFWAMDNSIRHPGPNGTSINLSIDLKTIFASENEWERQSSVYLPDEPAVIRPFGSTFRAQHTIPFRMPLWFAVKDIGLGFNLRLVPTEEQGDSAIYGELNDLYYIVIPDLDTPEEFTVTVEWDNEIGQVCQSTFSIEVEPIAFTLFFDSTGGSDLTPLTLNYGTAIPPPEPPVKPDHTFAGWNPAVPDTMPSTNTTVVAQWTINQYTISFDANGGSEVAAITQDYNTAVTAPVDPTRDGYTFTGWSPPIPVTIPAENTTCVAQWTVNQYTVTFDANGGTSSLSEQTYNVGVAYAELPTASRPDYTFSGWWTSPAGGQQITVDTLVPLPTSGHTLYAHWDILPDHHSITVPLHAGWNLICAKLNLTDASQQKLRGKMAMKLSQVDNSYVLCDKLSVPDACWVFAPDEEEITLVGTSPEDFDFEAGLQPGWNFVGPLEDWSLVGSGAIAWGWNGERFYPTNILRAGHGYYLYWPGDYVAPAEDTYLIIDLSVGPSAASYPVSTLSAVPAGGWTDVYKTTKLVLRKIPAGTFTMGSPEEELGRNSNETQHQVTLTKDFYVGVFEVTQKQWERVMGSWPSYFHNASHRDARPVEKVSYDDIRGSSAGAGWPGNNAVDADSFLGRLRAKTGLTFDLPTEAQWEYACRAGTTTALNSGKNLTSTGSCPNMSEVGRYWYNGGSGYSSGGDTSGVTAKVGSYLPNQWGLYDMHGNVSEWCLDWYQSELGSSAQTDPWGAAGGSHRVGRGGGWPDNARLCRSAYCSRNSPSSRYDDLGFRLVRAVP
ncbi:MAG: leucine-rich repeat protein [Candidatus Cloacimonetes bacterium]|nr:leucine-rich repeat protein [Candidatus Cloacimonadota bacterium]